MRQTLLPSGRDLDTDKSIVTEGGDSSLDVGQKEFPETTSID